MAAEAQPDPIAVNKATEALEAAVSRGEPTSDTLFLLGRARLLAGDLTAAEQTFKQATAQFPIEPAAFLQLADVAERLAHFAHRPRRAGPLHGRLGRRDPAA